MLIREVEDEEFIARARRLYATRLEQRLETHREEAEEVNEHGSLPIHMAVFNNFPLSTVQALIDAFPQGLLSVASGWTPFTLAMSPRMPRIENDIIPLFDLFFNANELSVRETDNNGNLSLHVCMILENVPLQWCWLLLRHFPNDVHATNDRNVTPLHFQYHHFHLPL